MARKKRITKKVLFTKTVEILQPLLYLDGWQFKIRFKQSMKNAADCEALPEYKHATIWVDHTHLRELSHAAVISMAIHEMSHCIVWPLGELAASLSRKDNTKLEICRQYEESTVTHIERILLPLVMATVNEKLRTHGYYPIELDSGPIQIITEA